MKGVLATTKTASVLAALLLLCFSVHCCCGEEVTTNTDGSPMEVAERESLFSAVQGFVGEWWNGSDLYPDPCGWTPIQGVSCGQFGDGLWYVTDLNVGPVHDNSLECAANPLFTPRFFELKHLQSISFFNCFKSSITIPSQNWETFSSTLESLEFRSNPGLTGQIPSVFGTLMNLKSLVIIENRLNGQLPASLGDLSSLKRLVLSGNQFKGPIPDSFGGLPELLILDLSRNSLSGTIPPSIGELGSLLKLDLSFNQLQSKLPSELGKLKNMTLLDLSSNNFSGGLIQSIQDMTSLEELVLSKNPIGGNLKVVSWQNLQDMTTLDLSETGLVGEIPDSMSLMKNLRFLGLSNNNLSGPLSLKIETLPNMSALYLNGNNLTGEIKFSGGFLGRMGRRFGAWNNPNLCYPLGEEEPSANVPYRVRPCGEEEEETAVESNRRGKLLSNGGDMEESNSYSVPSLGFESNGVGGFKACNFRVCLLMAAIVLISSFI